MRKLSTTKLYISSISTTLVFVISPSEVVWKFWISICEDFKLNFRTIYYFKWISSQLQCFVFFRIYNFGFGHFSIRDHLANSKKLNLKNVRTSNRICWIQMNSNEKFTHYKVVDLFETYNFNIKFVFIQLDLEKL